MKKLYEFIKNTLCVALVLSPIWVAIIVWIQWSFILGLIAFAGMAFFIATLGDVLNEILPNDKPTLDIERKEATLYYKREVQHGPYCHFIYNMEGASKGVISSYNIECLYDAYLKFIKPYPQCILLNEDEFLAAVYSMRK